MGEILCTYNGVTRCNVFDPEQPRRNTWEKQQPCTLACKSVFREQCMYMRPQNGTCSHEGAKEARDD